MPSQGAQDAIAKPGSVSLRSKASLGVSPVNFCETSERPRELDGFERELTNFFDRGGLLRMSKFPPCLNADGVRHANQPAKSVQIAQLYGRRNRPHETTALQNISGNFSSYNVENIA